jgi:hypothetical protein
MTEQREVTLDDLLSEPIIRKVMARDGVRAEDIRRLVQQASVRKTPIGYRHLNSRAKVKVYPHRRETVAGPHFGSGERC